MNQRVKRECWPGLGKLGMTRIAEEILTIRGSWSLESWEAISVTRGESLAELNQTQQRSLMLVRKGRVEEYLTLKID